jgi:hypothetical protein
MTGFNWRRSAVVLLVAVAVSSLALLSLETVGVMGQEDWE